MKRQFCIFIIFVLSFIVCFAADRSGQSASGGSESVTDTVFVSFRVSKDAPLQRTYIVGDFAGSFIKDPAYCDCDPLVSWLPPTAISTNMLYDCLLVPNIGISMAVAPRFTAGVDWMATWLNDSRHHYYRIYGGDFDLRYRIGGADNPLNPFSGHHLGLYASLVYYDLQRGVSHRGVMSAKYNYAVGVSYTYSLPVARHFNINFSLGIGYMWGKFKRHTPIDDHDVWLSTSRRSWLGPTRAEISLVWILGNGVYNENKGGSRR